MDRDLLLRSWPVFLFVVPMLVGATLTGRRDLIFPEGAALALGVLVLDLPGWTESPGRLLALPPLCAGIGLAVLHLHLAPWIGEITAVSAALACLQLLSSRLTPAISAAALPVAFGVGSLLFLATVSCISIALAVATMLRSRRPDAGHLRPISRIPAASAVGAWAASGLWIIVAVPLLGLGAAAVAPPLIVALTERLSGPDRSALTSARHWTVLVMAAALGALAVGGVVASALGGVVAVALVLAAFAYFSGPHPPALAICLIPQIAEVHGVAYVFDVAIGALALYSAAGLIWYSEFGRAVVSVRKIAAVPPDATDIEPRQQPID
jgi:hypothetical protein